MSRSQPNWRWVCKEIRKSILLGHLTEGTEKRLQEEFKLERAPVRQALSHLKSEGIIEILPKQGFRVRRIEREDLQGILDARLAMEFLAAAVLWRRIHRPSHGGEKIDWNKIHGELLQTHRRMEAISSRLPESSMALASEKASLFVDFLDLDVTFHAAIAGCGGYDVAVCFLRKLHNLMLVAIPTTTNRERVRDILDEHERIIKALQFGTMADVKATIRDNLFGFTRLWSPYKFLKRIRRLLEKPPSRRSKRIARHRKVTIRSRQRPGHGRS